MTADAEPGAPTRSRPVLIAAVATGLVAVLLIVLLIVSKPGGEDPESPLIGKPAPALAGEAYQGDPLDVGLNDRWLVVNFFATWCAPCIAEHPELVSFAEAHAEIGDARVVSIAYDDKPERVRDFFARRGGDWSVLDDDNGRTPLDWGVARVPESFLVSPTGIVVKRFQSGVTEELLDSYIEAYTEATSNTTAGGTGS